MENQSGNTGTGSPGSGSTDIPISSRVDPTSVMPPFPEGRAVDSMSIEDAQKEWQEMTIDSEGKYSSFPRSVFLSRRDALFSHGFGQKIAEGKKIQEGEAEKWLQKENERIQDREELLLDQKSKELNVKFFGSEKVFNQMAERAVEVVLKLSENDQEFLKNCMPGSDLSWGDSPLIIGFLANLRGEPELINKIKENGLEHYISLWSKLPRRQK